MEDFEKLGVFYLGREYDLPIKAPRDDLLLYDSKDLVIHGVCVGMTGSGKTRLSIGLVDEAALDGVPGIVIDPKCDLADLMPTFPDLRPEDLRPWINEEGLADWGESGDRIRRLCEAADFAIYTAGSSAGLPISILASFAGPRPHATFPSFSETGSPLECPPPVVPLRMRVLKRPIGGRERTRTMPKGRKHTPEQIVRHLRDAEAGLTAGRTVGQICQEIGVSEQTYYRWKSRYGGMNSNELRRLKELEQENLRLKKLVADLTLDVAMRKELAEGNL